MTSWLDEDPELLRAALEIIEAWDEGDTGGDRISVRSPLTDGYGSTSDDLGGAVEATATDDVEVQDDATDDNVEVVPRVLSHNDTASKMSDSGEIRDLQPSTVGSTSHRRREEIIYLRDKVKEMKAQLATLAKAKNDSEAASSTEASADKALTIMWRGIATRQQRLRQKSELDQAKLRTLLEMQMRVAEALMKLMRKARCVEDDEAFPSTKRARFSCVARPRLDEGEQLARLYTYYDNLDAAFAFPKFHDGSLKFVDIQVTDEIEEEVVIEYREAWTLPFDVEAVLGALWQYTLKKNEEKWCEPGYDANTTMRMDGTELVSRYAARSTIAGFTGGFNGQTIVKRFPGGGNKPPAIIAVTDTESEPVVTRDIEGFFMDDYTFLRVLPVEGAGFDGKHITSVQCMQRFELRFEDKALHSRPRAGVLTNMILEKLKEEIELKHSTVETLLLSSR